MQDPTPTLAELTQVVFALRQELTQAVTEGLVEHPHRAVLEQRTAVCPPVWADVGSPWPPGPPRRDAGGGDSTAAPVLLLRALPMRHYSVGSGAAVDQAPQAARRPPKVGGPGARTLGRSERWGPGRGGKPQGAASTCSRTTGSSMC